jgi:hypothetical protein
MAHVTSTFCAFQQIYLVHQDNRQQHKNKKFTILGNHKNDFEIDA